MFIINATLCTAPGFMLIILAYTMPGRLLDLKAPRLRALDHVITLHKLQCLFLGIPKPLLVCIKQPLHFRAVLGMHLSHLCIGWLIVEGHVNWRAVHNPQALASWHPSAQAPPAAKASQKINLTALLLSLWGSLQTT